MLALRLAAASSIGVWLWACAPSPPARPPDIVLIAIDTLRDRTRAGDGGASAFLIEHARQAGLDSVQSFGGYGYMEDYRVERYLRDANTLETFFIHASATTRRIAATSFAELQR